jgi:lysine/ornithine N-monooxygenase
MDKRYAKQIIGWAEEAKETLTIRKEIIIDESVTDEKLGNIIRMMYRAKVEAQNEQIKHATQKAEL